MNKKFGIGSILGEPDLKVIFEYYNKNNYLIVGQDLITGLSVMSTYSPKHKYDMVTSESNELLNEGFIHIQHYEQISRREMIEQLRTMSNADIEMYIIRMNDVKAKISQDIKTR